MYAMSVSEDKVPGEEVGRLKARDPDLGENGLVTYRLVEGDGMSVFEISTDSQSREGVIKLKKVREGGREIDRERLCGRRCEDEVICLQAPACRHGVGVV